MVCKHKKSSYRIKQASQKWYLMFNETIVTLGFKENMVDRCTYLKVSGSMFIMLVMYIDDNFLATNDLGLFQDTKRYLSINF